MLHSYIPSLTSWAPFQLDALGLVTVFGAKEMNTAVGHLVSSSVTEYLPVLAAYTVANNEIVQPQPGYVLYNISDGIMATDVAGWFTRWLVTFPLTYTATTIRLRAGASKRESGNSVNGIGCLSRSFLRRGTAALVGVCTFGLLMGMAIITADAWGVANVVSMLVSVLSRQIVVRQLRSSIDDAVSELSDSDSGSSDPSQDVKVFLTLPTGKAVTIYGPRMLIVRCLLTDAKPTRPRIYYLARMACWAAFGAHAITLGMSSLFNQILSVVVLLLGTYLTSVHVGDSRERIGGRLKLDVDMGDPGWSRGPAYMRLGMSEVEEECMVHWSMMPQRSNGWWWERYRRGMLPSQMEVHTADEKGRVDSWESV